jgi:maltodextrin utilization protein YvdJ
MVEIQDPRADRDMRRERGRIHRFMDKVYVPMTDEQDKLQDFQNDIENVLSHLSSMINNAPIEFVIDFKQEIHDAEEGVKNLAIAIEEKIDTIGE